MESYCLVSIFLIRKDSYWFLSNSSYVVSLFLFTPTFVIYLFNKQICIQCFLVWDIHVALCKNLAKCKN